MKLHGGKNSEHSKPTERPARQPAPAKEKPAAEKPAPTPPAAMAVEAAPVAEEATVEETPAEDISAKEAPAPVSFESDAPFGYEVGQQLADFTTPTFDGGEFHLADKIGRASCRERVCQYV